MSGVSICLYASVICLWSPVQWPQPDSARANTVSSAVDRDGACHDSFSGLEGYVDVKMVRKTFRPAPCSTCTSTPQKNATAQSADQPIFKAIKGLVPAARRSQDQKQSVDELVRRRLDLFRQRIVPPALIQCCHYKQSSDACACLRKVSPRRSDMAASDD